MGWGNTKVTTHILLGDRVGHTEDGMHISFIYPPNPLKWLLLAHDHGCDVTLKVTDRSVHTIFRGSLTIFLYYGSDHLLLSFLLPTAQATGRPKLYSQILDQYSFQSLEQISEKKKKVLPSLKGCWDLWDGSMGKNACHKPRDRRTILGTLMVKGETQSSQVVLWHSY